MNLLEKMCPELTVTKIREIAFDTKFIERVRKIMPEDFLTTLCEQSLKGTVSYSDIATEVSCEYGVDASKQAYMKKMKNGAVNFFKEILAFVIQSKVNIEDIKLTHVYKRILVQDSTVIKLPLNLFKDYSGVSNGHTKVCNARIQCTYDLISGTFVDFSIDSYSRNDLKAAYDVEVKVGDLLLRDRGYFIADALEVKKNEGADQIFRHKYRTTFWDVDTKKKVDIFQYLEQFGKIDQLFYIGKNKDIKVRVIGTPVKEEISNIRKMNAKKDAKGHKCSKGLLKSLEWSVFLTTITDTNITSDTIYKIYGLRWRIENIFKTWKSELNFSKIHTVSKIQLQCLLYSRFIMIVLLYQRYYTPLEKKIKYEFNKDLSLRKLLRYIVRNLKRFVLSFRSKSGNKPEIDRITKYCTYETRKRENYNSHLNNVLDVFSC